MKKIIFLFFILSQINAFAQNVNLPSEILWAERISATKYVVKQQNKGKWKVYVGKNPKDINWSNKPQKLKDSLNFDVLPTERLFFAAVRKKDTVIFSERRLWFDAMPNFRDLGGLKTIDGRTVAWNKLLRCGDMGQLTDNDLTILKNLQVKNVVDFRNEQEVAKSPDKYPKDYEINRVWTSISPSNGEGMKAFYKVMANPNVKPEEVETVFEGFYAKMPENIKNYAPFFKTLLETEQGAIVFHCTAGKDRTGFGSALILSVLGVSEEDIINEYALSNRYTEGVLSKTMMGNMKPEVAKILAGVKPAYIKATLKTIKEQYGSVNNMLEKELGIGTVQREKLIRMFTF